MKIRIFHKRLALDAALSAIGSLAAILTMRAVSDPFPRFSRLVLLWVVAASLLTVLGLLLTRSSDVVMRFASLRGYSRLASAIFVKEAGLGIVLVLGLLRLPSVALSLVTVFADLIYTSATIFFPRILVRTVRREERDIKAAAGRLNTLVAGTDDTSVALADKIEAGDRYNVLGFLTDDPALSGKVIGERIVYCSRTPAEMDDLQWRLGGIDCIFFPKGQGAAGRSGSEEKGSGLRSDANGDAMSHLGHVVKRGFDVMLSSLLMLVFSPLAALIALAVHLEDGGPVIYAQERLGRGGKPFPIYKFRSMHTDAEADGGPALYTGDDDPRLTHVGKFLRQHHLDELPQLWNVFCGDMSFIGYRPERRYYIDQIQAINPRYRFLFQIRPGVTSYATLYNGYTDTLDKMLTRLDLDLYYLRNHSLWFDARLLLLTFLRIVFGRKF